MSQSLSPYLFKLFPSSNSIITSHTGDIPIGDSPMSAQLLKEKEYNISAFRHSDISRNKFNSEFEMFLDEEKKNIFLLKLHVDYNYSNDKSVVTMYSIPIDNFVISTREEFNLNKSCIKKIWEKKIGGIIQKYSLSQDKKFLSIILNRINDNNITSIIKHIELFNYDNTINNNKTEEGNSTGATQVNKTNELKEDEVNLSGNLPLISIDVSKDVIVLSRERKEFIDIFIKNNTNNLWEEYNINLLLNNNKLKENENFSKINSSGTNSNETLDDNNKNPVNKQIYSPPVTYFNHINSFKIIKDNRKALSIIQLYITSKSTGIFANSVMINFNKKNLTADLKKIFSYRLDKSSDEEDKEVSYIYDIKHSLSQLKDDYFHNSVFSKNSGNFKKMLNFEFFHRTLVSMNLTTLELEKIGALSSGIKSIQSDEKNNNLIAIDENKKIYYFYKRDDDDIFEDYKIINLNNIPNKYRNNEILASYIETFGKDKTRLFLLLNKGVIISLDFGKLIKKMNRNIIMIVITDYFYSIVMLGFNLIVLIFVLKKRKQQKNTNNDIRNVINNLGNRRRE